SRTMTSTQARYRPKRVYEILSAAEGSRQIRLSDRIVELGEREYRRYEKVACWLSTTRGVADLSRELEMDEAKVPKLIDAHEKSIKQLRAKHYAEEWNHFHYFMKSLKHLGFTEPQIAASVPLPMTLALSNFMRQAARQDILAYSICSAVLEGTTTDRKTYN